MTRGASICFGQADRLAMFENLPPQQLYDFIVNDFEDAWNSLAANPTARGRGNFMFARQAMTLLEFASRLCASDRGGAALRDLSEELYRIEPKYFTVLPGACYKPKDFDLPSTTSTPEHELIWAMFDMIRNGQAHQYQQIIVRLTNNTSFAIALSGARFGFHLDEQLRPSEHLSYRSDGQGGLLLLVYPEVLFLDLKRAVAASGILNRGLSFDYLARPQGKKRRSYQFSSADLESTLASAGHPESNP
jgi:hypothetical protein